jgi:hypothetical protein
MTAPPTNNPARRGAQVVTSRDVQDDALALLEGGFRVVGT